MSSLTYIAAIILHSISSGRRYGFQIMDAAGLASGTVYPALRKLEKSGLVRSKWERDTVAHAEQRPARKYYEVTRDGEAALREAALRYRFPEFEHAAK